MFNEHINYKWVSINELATYLNNDIYNDLKSSGMINELNNINKRK